MARPETLILHASDEIQAARDTVRMFDNLNIGGVLLRGFFEGKHLASLVSHDGELFDVEPQMQKLFGHRQNCTGDRQIETEISARKIYWWKFTTIAVCQI